MIPNPSARPSRSIEPISAWVTILVIALHSLAAWAVISIDSPERPELKGNEPEPIQLELVTLVTLPPEKPRIEPKVEPKAEPQLRTEPEQQAAEPIEKSKPASVLEPVSEPKSEPQPKLQSEKKAAEPVEKAKSAPVLEALKQPESEPKEQQSDPIEKETKPEEETKTPVPVQKLIIEELVKITKTTTGEEIDLDAMIRAVREQYNRDQAGQQQEARKQANRERAEQDRLQAQAEKQKAGKAEQENLDKEADASNEPVNFSEEQASWLHEHGPNTSLPSEVWRNTDAKSGEVFIVLLELQVDKEGYITEVQLLESSGDQLIDAVAMVQVRAGQLKPLQQNGLPVNGIVPMSLSYERP